VGTILSSRANATLVVRSNGCLASKSIALAVNGHHAMSGPSMAPFGNGPFYLAGLADQTATPHLPHIELSAERLGLAATSAAD
jgi:hypothetical protein